MLYLSLSQDLYFSPFSRQVQLKKIKGKIEPKIHQTQNNKERKKP